jgi:4-amino-4-deoxy-L-arabinose transferase-like glycosyltransferase
LWAGLVVALFSLSSTKLITYILPAFPAFALLVGEAVANLFEQREKTSARRVTESLPLFITVFLNVVFAIAAWRFLLDDRILPRAEALPYVIIVSVILIAGSVVLWRAWYSRDATRVAVSQIATAALLIVAALQLTTRITLYEDSSPLIKTLVPHLQTGDVVAQAVFQPSAVFYVARPVIVTFFKNTSGLDEDKLRRSSRKKSAGRTR